MAGEKKSIDWVLVGLVLAVGLFAGALLFPKSNVQYVSNVTCPSCQSLFSGNENLGVLYLYPVECPACNVSRVNAVVSSTGVPFMAFMNDGVQYPNVLVVYRNSSADQSISTIARASNDYNVVSTLCLAKNQMACEMKDGMASVMQSCLGREGIPLDSVIYYYSDWCGTLCNNMNDSLLAIEKDGFNVVRINERDSTPVKECLKDFLNYAGGYPQMVCPRRVISNTGALSRNSLESFAEECRK
ncbi:MAG: hypothetical protein PHG85_01740 [Candidatus Altiarchaeota archaeon]|nr:hypothetical protein [Candidatus Altiarchaeota archaeon]